MTAGTREDVDGGYGPGPGNEDGRRTGGANGRAAGGRGGGGDKPQPANGRGDADGPEGARGAAGGARGRAAANGARGRGDGARRGRGGANGARGRAATNGARARVADEDGGNRALAVGGRSGGPRPREAPARGNTAAGGRGGPYDEDEVDLDRPDGVDRTDFGALRLPVPAGGVVDVEPSTKGKLQAVHITLPGGRLSVSALAAPTTGRLWPELAKEINTSLRAGGARVRSVQGRWGRELRARTGGAFSVFVGIDGPRWMVYGVATGPEQEARALDRELRRVLGETVVVRGRSPYPVRTVLPLVLPEDLQAEREARLEREQAAAAALQAQAAAAAPEAAIPAAAEAERAVADVEPVAPQPAAPGPDRVTRQAPDPAAGAAGRGPAPAAHGAGRAGGGYRIADRSADRGSDRGAPAGYPPGAEPRRPVAPAAETALLRLPAGPVEQPGRGADHIAGLRGAPDREPGRAPDPIAAERGADAAGTARAGTSRVAGYRSGAEPGPPIAPAGETALLRTAGRPTTPPAAAETTSMPAVDAGADEQATEEFPVPASWRDGGLPAGGGAAPAGALSLGPGADQAPPTSSPWSPASAAPPAVDPREYPASPPARRSPAADTTALAATPGDPDLAWGTPEVRGDLPGTGIPAAGPAADGAWREPGVDGSWPEPGVDGAWREPVHSWEAAPAESAWAEPAASAGASVPAAHDAAATQPIRLPYTVDRFPDADPSAEHTPSAGGTDPVGLRAPAGPALAFLDGDPMALFAAAPPGRHRKGD